MRFSMIVEQVSSRSHSPTECDPPSRPSCFSRTARSITHPSVTALREAKARRQERWRSRRGRFRCLADPSQLLDAGAKSLWKGEFLIAKFARLMQRPHRMGRGRRARGKETGPPRRKDRVDVISLVDVA